MNVVIVEDEKLAAEKIIHLLKIIEPEINILTILETVEDAVNWFSANKSPDLIFMDIQLDDGISFEIFDEIKINAPVIFTTAFDEYAIRAFKVNSVDYLLKPIEKEALKLALEKFKTIFSNSFQFEEKISTAIAQISKKYKSRFFIKVGQRFQSIPSTQVCAFFVQERNTFLSTTNGKTYDLDYSLDQLQKITDPDYFFRVNRNYMVNINCIGEIIGYSANRLKIQLNSNKNPEIIVSRDKVSEFKRWLDR